MKKLLTLLILIAIIGGFFLYDKIIGQRKNPRFYLAPALFCNFKKYSGITLPPFGIWLCKNVFDDENTRRHELIHWDQYRRFGTLGFYLKYVFGWIKAGFGYTNNWMEVEAREKSGCCL